MSDISQTLHQDFRPHLFWTLKLLSQFAVKHNWAELHVRITSVANRLREGTTEDLHEWNVWNKNEDLNWLSKQVVCLVKSFYDYSWLQNLIVWVVGQVFVNTPKCTEQHNLVWTTRLTALRCARVLCSLHFYLSIFSLLPGTLRFLSLNDEKSFGLRPLNES